MYPNKIKADLSGIRENFWPFDISSKELTYHVNLVAVHDGRPVPIVTVRQWMSKRRGASTAYCEFKLHFDNERGGLWYASGYGKAKGYGWHRPSAALHAAIENAGIRLSESISGVGNGAMDAAILAIGRALGFTDDQMIIVGT